MTSQKARRPAATLVAVVNPNSDPRMTVAITAAAQGAIPGVPMEVRQLEDGPPVIETDEQLEHARRLLTQAAAELTCRVLVVACHGDPGVREARRPGLQVLGMGEVSMLVAAATADRFSVLSLTEPTAGRKWRQLRSYGLADRCVSVEPTGPAEALTRDTVDLSPYVQAVERAVRSGAEAIVLGCAGMAPLVEQLRARTDVPVIEPVSATCHVAVSLAVGSRQPAYAEPDSKGRACCVS